MLKSDLDKVTDKLGMPLDKGVRKLVYEINNYGVKTNGSCWGHKQWGKNYPWIDIEVSKNSRDFIRRFDLEFKDVFKDNKLKELAFIRILPVHKNLKRGRLQFKKLEKTLRKINRYK